MKKLLVYGLLSMLVADGFAQQTKDTLLTVIRDTLDKKKSKLSIKFMDYKDDEEDTKEKGSKFNLQFIAARFDVGLSTYTDKGSYTLSSANSFLERETWKSSNFGFEFFQMGYRFNNHFKIYAAAGLDWNYMRLKQNITFQKDKPTLTYVTDAVDYKKNQFSSKYLRIPLSFQFRSNDDHKGDKLNFVIGPEIGFLLNGEVKQVSDENGRDKFKDDYNLNPFRYGAFARLGYGGMGVYIKYYGNDVFAEGQGPEDFRNLSFGLMFGF
ncbi:MAG: hypothetical protein FJY21_02950 [Bacteroidetes bacterium]|nr:hypothetical protein [Bacteroidota bacterium]